VAIDSERMAKVKAVSIIRGSVCSGVAKKRSFTLAVALRFVNNGLVLKPFCKIWGRCLAIKIPSTESTTMATMNLETAVGLIQKSRQTIAAVDTAQNKLFVLRVF